MICVLLRGADIWNLSRNKYDGCLDSALKIRISSRTSCVASENEFSEMSLSERLPRRTEFLRLSQTLGKF